MYFNVCCVVRPFFFFCRGVGELREAGAFVSHQSRGVVTGNGGMFLFVLRVGGGGSEHAPSPTAFCMPFFFLFLLEPGAYLWSTR